MGRVGRVIQQRHATIVQVDNSSDEPFFAGVLREILVPAPLRSPVAVDTFSALLRKWTERAMPIDKLLNVTNENVDFVVELELGRIFVNKDLPGSFELCDVSSKVGVQIKTKTATDNLS